MLRGLAGKTAIVTGGSTIIGRAVVRELHANGAAVAIADIDAAPGEALAAELGDRVLFTHTDITDDAQVEACVAAALDRFGRVDILVNLACSYLDEGVASPRADWLERARRQRRQRRDDGARRASAPRRRRAAARSSTSPRSRPRSRRPAAGSTPSRRRRSSS